MAELTVGLVMNNNFPGVYSSLQAIRLHQDVKDVHFVVADMSNQTSTLIRTTILDLGAEYIAMPWACGPSIAKETVVWAAPTDYVLYMDPYTLLLSDTILRLKSYYDEHPDTKDLLQGPRVFANGKFSTHYDLVWYNTTFGTEVVDTELPSDNPFEIQMQNMAVFSIRKHAWPGLHPLFYGPGGEEGYIHEKIRRAGGKCLCLPWFKWTHPGKLAIEHNEKQLAVKIMNYLVGWRELGFHEGFVIDHFRIQVPPHVIAEAIAMANDVLPRN